MTNEQMFRLLAWPFPESDIHWRVGARTKDKSKGIALAYLDARDVMYRLDDVVGPENWDSHHEIQDGKCICTISVTLVDADEFPGVVSKADGAGATDVEGEKGMISDAFKRAAVSFGIGRYLYSIPNKWYQLNEYGNKFVESPQLPSWATPEGWGQVEQKRAEKRSELLERANA